MSSGGTQADRRRAGVMGSPIAHSLSPALHLAAYRSLGLDGWRYDVREVDAAGLGPVLDQLGPEWVGVSLTMPLKQAVLALADEVSDLAAAVGAVNTLTFANGRRRGDNTDVHGIVAALREAGLSHAAGAVILGGGATAASALAAVMELGEREPLVAVRSSARATALLEAAERLGVAPRLVAWGDAPELLRQAPVVVSTVPAGAADELAGQMAGQMVGPVTAGPGTLLDVVYRPWPTPLAHSWAARGGTAVPGLDMLLHQAARQVELWTGSIPDLEAMRVAAEAVLNGRNRA